MALILAIEPDRRQAAQLTALVRTRVGADLVLTDTTEQALGAIGDRVPDLILIPALLAPQDDAALAVALRVIAVTAHVQMLTIPVLAAAHPKNQPRGVLAKWRRRRSESNMPDGCDPAMFGDQIAAYLAEAAAERAGHESAEVDLDGVPPTELSTTEVLVEAPVVAEAIEPEVAAQFVEELASITYAMEETPVVVVEDLPIEEPGVEDLTMVAAAARPTTEDIGDDLRDGAFSIHEPTVYELQIDDLSVEELSREEATIAAAVEESTVQTPFSPDEPAPIERVELWMPLSFGAQRTWPHLEGVLAEARQEEPVVKTEVVVAPPKPEWTELIKSLRQDVERLRTERHQPSTSVVRREQETPPSVVAPSPPKRPAAVTDILTKTRKPAKPTKPAQDEWGLFDPEQCGFAALLAKLEEITQVNDGASRLA